MDHYQTLNVSPNASQEEIKKAFRKLALQYHPDKNTSPDASRRFQQIQQAWEVLKDRRSRNAYNYRRYTQQPQQASRPLAKNIDELLRETNRLYQRTAGLDPFRVDFDRLLFSLKDVLSDHNRQLFLATDQLSVQAQVFSNILASMQLLPFPVMRELFPQLIELTATNPALKKTFDNWQKQAQWQYSWNHYKIWFALALALLFCLCLVLI